MISTETLVMLGDDHRQPRTDAPLIELTRPRSLSECIGQSHLIGANGFLTQSLESGIVPSLILFGPCGVGKTTIAALVAQKCDYEFVATDATEVALAELKSLCSTIEKRNRKRPRHDPIRIVVFIDEIHRFSKTQQDYLLPYVELGLFSFIGATTVDPSLRLCRALLSRCQVLELEPLCDEDMQRVVQRALERQNAKRWRDKHLPPLKLSPECVREIACYGDGDARKAVKVVEIIGLQFWETNADTIEVDADLVRKIISQTGTKRRPVAADGVLLKQLLGLINSAYDQRETHCAVANQAIMSLPTILKNGPNKEDGSNKRFLGADVPERECFSYRYQVSDSSDDDDDESISQLNFVASPVSGLAPTVGESEYLERDALSTWHKLSANGVDHLVVMRHIMLVVLDRSDSLELDLVRMMLLIRECEAGPGNAVEQLICMAFRMMERVPPSLAMQFRNMKTYCEKDERVIPFSVTFDDGHSDISTDPVFDTNNSPELPQLAIQYSEKQLVIPKTESRNICAATSFAPFSVTFID